MPQPPDTNEVIFLGIGLLNWRDEEEKTGRYGLVGLHDEIDRPALFMPRATDLIGARGKLRAIIRRHFKRKIRFGASAPLGAIVELGVGTVFLENNREIGVWPVPYRDLYWLNPQQLLLCAEQEVLLEFSLLDFLFEPTP